MTFTTIHPGYALLLLSTLLWQCQGSPDTTSNTETPPATPGFSVQPYGKTTDGQEVDIYTLKNAKGMELQVITYGGIITSWTAPDKEDNYQNVVLGYDNLEQYEASNPYFGALIGRYGNRIAKGQFELDGTTWQLETNDGSNHLHGGTRGFDKVVWSAEAKTGEQAVELVLRYTSPDGEGGYPGTLNTEVVYSLNNDDELVVTYTATTDKKTIVNLTQHSYFNLSGDFTRNVQDHLLEIAADAYLPVDETLIPTGQLAPVEGTPFDFRSAKPIGQDLETEDEQLARGRGYDHCWALNNPGTYRKAATVAHPGSGRLLEIFTDEPGIQFYGGNFLDGTLPMPGGGTYAHRTGFCLETQHYPDSPNQPAFPSVVLEPGQTYQSKTSFKFSTKTNSL